MPKRLLMISRFDDEFTGAEAQLPEQEAGLRDYDFSTSVQNISGEEGRIGGLTGFEELLLQRKRLNRIAGGKGKR